MAQVRVKPGVRPYYGGRPLEVVEWHTYPNGRRIVWVHAPKPPWVADHTHR